jgi:hypothetical protein
LRAEISRHGEKRIAGRLHHGKSRRLLHVQTSLPEELAMFGNFFCMLFIQNRTAVIEGRQSSDCVIAAFYRL